MIMSKWVSLTVVDGKNHNGTVMEDTFSWNVIQQPYWFVPQPDFILLTK